MDKGLGQIDRESAQWILDWDKEYILIGIAVDADGNYGPSYRQRFTPVKDGVSPIEDIIQSRQNVSASLTMDLHMPSSEDRVLLRR